MNTKITRTKTIGALKAMHGRPEPGYQFFQRPLSDENTVDLFIVPGTAPATSAYEIPEGGRLIGIVEYESRDAALRDQS